MRKVGHEIRKVLLIFVEEPVFTSFDSVYEVINII